MNLRPVALSLVVASLAFGVLAQNATKCASIQAGSPELNGGASATSFSATQIIDLDVSVLFPRQLAKDFRGDHLLEIQFITPKGHLYQSSTIPFTADQGNRKKKVAGYPDPIAVQVLRPEGAHLVAGVRLPVAGTLIMTNSLYGEWAAKAFVDGAQVSCAAPSVFTITQ
jgi:hypothetical protein